MSEQISNGELSIMHENSEEGYRITVMRVADGMMVFSWLMDVEDAARFAEQIYATLDGSP